MVKNRFVSDYYVWIFQRERQVRIDIDQNVGEVSYVASEEASSTYHTIVLDAAGPEFNVDAMEKPPKPKAQKFYEMLKAADLELWPRCQRHSQ